MKRRSLTKNGMILLLMVGFMAALLLARATPASAAFSQSDLAGTWYLVETADNPTSNGPFWSWATVTVDATGAITGGTFTNSMNESGQIPSGLSLTIDANGLVSSPMPPPPGGIGFPHGKLDPSKTILTLAVTESEGDVGLMIGIKGGGTVSVPADFNADGKPDILWRNTTTGANVVWFMDGTTITGAADLPGAPVVWSIVGTADFNGDTHPDILWRNTTTGANVVWFMDGTTITGAADLPGAPIEWTIVGPK